MSDKIKKVRLKGNESFNFREGWLRKGMRCVEEEPCLFAQDDVMERLGVGSKMVRSIRFWLIACGLCEERYINNGRARAFYISQDFGNVIKKYDKYFEDDFTLCLAITQLSSAKVAYKKIAEILRQNGYGDLAEATEKRLDDIETELIIKQKYEASLIELEKDIAMCKSVSSYTYADSQVLLTKLKNWKSFLSSAQDLPQTMKKKLQDRIDEADKQLNAHVQAIQMAIDNIFASAKNSKSLQDLMEAEKRLESITSFAPQESVLSDAAKMTESIHKVEAIINELPNQIDQLTNYRCPIQIGFASVIKAECQRKLNEFLKKQADWVKQYISPVEYEVRAMNAPRCSGWLSQTQTLPNYLDQQTVKRYHEVRRSVEQRLHNCRVQGVVSMFNELSSEEKEECLKILQKTN